MFSNTESAKINARILRISGCLFLAAILIINGIKKAYLFDCSIVYYYSYLLGLKYVPFIDFTSPLLPATAFLQRLFDNIFGFRYYSGIFGALAVILFQYFTIEATLRRCRIDYRLSILYSVLICLTSLPFIGSLYYNHLLVALATIVFVLKLSQVLVERNFRDSVVVEVSNYLIIAFIVFTKIHWGIFMLGSCILVDIMRFLKKRNFDYRPSVIGLLSAAIISIFLYAYSGISFHAYLDNMKSVSAFRNLNIRSWADFFNFPYTTNSLIQVGPTFIAILLIGYLVISKTTLKRLFQPEIILFGCVYLFCFLIVVISAESQTILISLTVLLFLIFDLLISKAYITSDGDSMVLRCVRFCFFIQIGIFGVLYSFNAPRKLWNMNEAMFMPTLLSHRHPRSFSNELDKSCPELVNYFRWVKFDPEEINEFKKMDSLIKLQKTSKIFFGPELEIFNIVYGIKPLKGFPLWVHRGLTVADEEQDKFKDLFKAQLPDIIVLSKYRVDFLFGVRDIAYADFTRISDSSSTIKVFIRKKTK